MPLSNDFQHAAYSRSDPGERVSYREFEPGAPPDSLAWQEAMARLGGELAKAGVRAVLFMHGTFLSTDLFGTQRLDEAGGLKRGYSRGIPGVDALLALMREDSNGLGKLSGGQKPPFHDDEQTKKLIDDQAKDAGNFSTDYVEQFKKAINRNVARPIVCTPSLWSSEHHHLGRALAAVQLLSKLRTICTGLTLGSGDRVLVQTHGQAGLVLALISNLLAPGQSSGRKTWIHALTSYLEQTSGTPEGRAQLDNLKQLASLMPAGTVLNGASLDIVTFGTPVRYGWDPSGLGKLLHIVNHRPMRIDGKRWLSKMELPQITMEMPIAWGGDYVQQLAVAGSDALPTSPEAQAANKTLWELLEPYDGFERWLECARKSVRCANDGTCLLVDYKDSTGSSNARDHLYGHAAYTRLNALLFNSTEIVDRLYPPT
ncbi:MAG: hypothetical protein E6K63_00445 [Nitrospirae bacterium]|nr:MAG: hypothetical protein E6K63_00445 [Nitrospirota bacterium]